MNSVNKELELLNHIAENPELSQRGLAKALDVSLGTVNHMIQDFEKANYIVTEKVNARNVLYTLTEKGQGMKNRLYIEHVSSCFDTVTHVRATFKEKLNQLVEEGKTNFYIQGMEDELIRLAKMSFFEISRRTKIDYTLIDKTEQIQLLLNKMDKEMIKRSVVVGWSTVPYADYGNLSFVNLLP